MNTLIGLPGPAGGAPPAAQVHVAMVQGAVYDAVNATEPKHYRPYLLNRRFSARASQDAAVATAAYGVLRSIVATVPNLAETARATLLQSLATQYASSLAEVPNGPFKAQGVAAGNAAAGAMIAARQDDGRFGPSQWVPNTAPGHWWPQLNATGQPILDPTPWVGDGGAVRHADLLAVPHLGTARAHERRVGQGIQRGQGDRRDQQHAPHAPRRPTSPGGGRARPWPAGTRSRETCPLQDGLSIADTARLLAMENLSGADAAINCWNDKYYWDFWRPWNAIPRAAEDGNPDTAPDAGWLPLISAPYPDHPSGHLCLDSAHSRVLQMFFGDAIAGGFQMSSISTLLGPADARTRTFGSFSQVLAEVTEARIWAGLHYRTADEQAKGLGRNVADYTAANYFQPVGRAH